MINNLIQAYRAKFYDFSLSDIWAIIKSKWVTLLVSLLIFFLMTSLLVISICSNLPILMSIVIVFEFSVCTIADRYIVKTYQESLSH